MIHWAIKKATRTAGICRSAQGHISESDIIARLGGDEFAVVVEVSEPDSEFVIKRRLKDKLDAANSRKDRRFILLISLGIVRYDPYHPCSIDELLSQSDKLMYANKKGKY
jgi:diguanylate cyclase (GGDEF)-like protein